ncbi:MAG: sigma-54 dependent transcriptional regulator [Spirochaetia bacterium]|nr:sigma-54 dependent transcriptional regulator [Spirochaetia bacterium]
MQRNTEKVRNLILTSIKPNYFVASALVLSAIKNADVARITADDAVDILLGYTGKGYENIYIIGLRLKENYLEGYREALSKFKQEKAEVKWYLLHDRVHIDLAKHDFFKAFLYIPKKGETLLDEISRNEKPDPETCSRLCSYYNRQDDVTDRSDDKKRAQQRKTDDDGKVFTARIYMDYIIGEYLNWRSEERIRECISKLAFDRIESDDIRKSAGFNYNYRHLSGKSPAISELRGKIEIVGADRYSSVLIFGETGVGKQHVAELIHNKSGRTGKLLSLNCAALTKNIVESELFGYEKGAFTGATETKKGIFEQADKGTVFLDEIGDLDLDVQAKLLRALEERKVRHVGDSKGEEIDVDIRLIAATNKNLVAEIAKEKFRPDLYYRLECITLTIPPLRERKEDIKALAVETMFRLCAERGISRMILTQEQFKVLESYDWPGNVRQLEQFLTNAIVFKTGDFRKLMDEQRARLERNGAPAPRVDSEQQDGSLMDLESWDKIMIERTLKETGFNQTHAAKSLGISLNTLKAKMEKHGMRNN